MTNILPMVRHNEDSKLKDLVISLLLGDSSIQQEKKTTEARLKIYLSENSLKFLESYIESHKLDISIIKRDKSKSDFMVEGDEIQYYLNLYKDNRIPKNEITKNVVLLWLCLFAHYDKGSYLVKTSKKFSDNEVYTFLQSYLNVLEKAQIAYINHAFYLDNLEEAFSFTIRENFPSSYSIRISQIMMGQENTLSHDLNNLNIFRKIFKGERINNVPYNY